MALERNNDLLNGVTTFDLVLIKKHILNVQSFSSMHEKIAADINQSGTITTLDMVQLRKVILHIDTEFSNNESWRFFKEHQWADMDEDDLNANLPSIFPLDNISQTTLEQNFIGVKCL